jgi:adenine-specific DNA-methyltransferase
MKKEAEGKLELKDRETPEDMGFKVFKLTTSNYRQWHEPHAGTADAKQYGEQMAMFKDALVEGWRPENVIYEVAIKEGFGLNLQVEPVHPQIPQIKSQGRTGSPDTDDGHGPRLLYRVTDPDKEQSFYICLDYKIRLDDLKPLNLAKTDLFICRDVALDDEAAANLALQCRLKTV